MEKRFETVTTYTPQTYREFSDYNMRGMLRITRLVFLACAALLALFTTIMLMVMGNRNTLAVLLSYGLVVVFLLLPFLVEWIVKRQVETGAKEADGLVDTCAFFDEYFTEINGDQQTTAFYPRVFKAAETAAYYYVYIDRSTAAVIAKDSFVIGDADAFRGFLNEKLGDRFTGREAAADE